MNVGNFSDPRANINQAQNIEEPQPSRPPVDSSQGGRDPRMDVSNLIHQEDLRASHIDSTQGQSLHRLADSAIGASVVSGSTSQAPLNYAQEILLSMIPVNVTVEQQAAIFQRMEQTHLLLEPTNGAVDMEDEEDDFEGFQSQAHKTANKSFFESKYSEEEDRFVATQSYKRVRDKIYASDAALLQLAKFEGVSDALVPSKLPTTITRSSIVNQNTIDTVLNLFSVWQDTDLDSNLEYVELRLDKDNPNSEENRMLNQLLRTPNGRMTTNMIRDFNTLMSTNYFISKATIKDDGYVAEAPTIDFTLSKDG